MLGTRTLTQLVSIVMKCTSFIIYLFLGFKANKRADKEECTISWHQQRQQHQQKKKRKHTSPKKLSTTPKSKKESNKPKSQLTDHLASSILLIFIKETFTNKA